MASCDDCRRIVAGLARAGLLPAAARGAGRVLGLPWPVVAVAAAVLVAFGVYVSRGGEAPSPDTDARLVAAASDLAAQRPEIFADFKPLDAAERAAGASDVRRGGLSPLVPAGATLSTRPDFRWSPVPSAKSYALKVIDAEGATVLETSATDPFVLGARLPKDLPRGGEFVWKVTATGARPPAEGTRAFSVVREVAVRSYDAARGAIAALGADVPKDLLLAHFAFRRGFLAEALEAARRHVAAHENDRAGRETLDRVTSAIGPGATGLR